jgi:hypothetical protein
MSPVQKTIAALTLACLTIAIGLTLAFVLPSVFAGSSAPCSASEISLYQQIDRDAKTAVVRNGPRGLDLQGAIDSTLRLKSISPACLAYLDKVLPQQQQQGSNTQTPSWTKRTWLPCECHGGSCAPCPGAGMPPGQK